MQGVVLRNYKLGSRLGDPGRFGDVYSAADISNDNLVFAIKIINKQFFSDPMFRKRFETEVTALYQLNGHPNIVLYHDSGIETYTKKYDSGETHKGIAAFIRMEKVKGKTLEQIIAEEKPLPIEKTIRIMSQVLDALEYAHQPQKDRNSVILHGDLHPRQVIVRDDGIVKVADFGLAKIIGERQSKGTITDSTMEYAAYRSPEGMVDERSDIFPVGIMLYRMAEKEGKRIKDNRLARIIQKAIAIHEDRYKTAIEMRRDLESLLESGRIIAMPIAPQIGVIPKPEVPKVPSLNELYRRALESKTFEEKSSLLEQIILENPGFRDAKKQLITAYKEEIDLAKGKKGYRQALRLAQHLSEILPKEGEPHDYLRSLYFAMGDIVAAMNHGETAVQLLPDNFWSHYYLGEVYERMQLKMSGTRYGSREWKTGLVALERAVQCYEKALEIQPGDPSAEAKLYKTRHALEELVRLEETEKQKRKKSFGRKLKVGAAIILFTIAGTGLWMNRDYFTTSKKPSITNIVANPEAQKHADLGYKYQLENKVNKAIVEYERALKLDPKYPGLRMRLFLLYTTGTVLVPKKPPVPRYEPVSQYSKTPKPIAAESISSPIPTSTPEATPSPTPEPTATPEVIYTPKATATPTQTPTPKITETPTPRPTLEDRVTEANRHLNLGLQYYLTHGDYDTAIREFKRVLALLPDSYDTRIHLGDVYLRKGQTGNAIREFETVLKVRPTDSNVLFRLGEVYTAQGRLEDAIALYKKVIEVHQGDYSAQTAQKTLATLEQKLQQQEKQKELERRKSEDSMRQYTPEDICTYLDELQSKGLIRSWGQSVGISQVHTRKLVGIADYLIYKSYKPAIGGGLGTGKVIVLEDNSNPVDSETEVWSSFVSVNLSRCSVAEMQERLDWGISQEGIFVYGASALKSGIVIGEKGFPERVRVGDTEYIVEQ